MAWIEYNPNPVGRRVGDCAIRAVAKALDVDWETAFATVALNAFLMGDMPSSNSVISATLRKNGYRGEAIPASCPSCYTAEDFLEDNPEGVFILFFSGHVATAEDGNLYDAFNSLKEIPSVVWYKDIKPVFRDDKD